MMISDTNFQEFKAGSEKAFEVIFYQYYKTLVSYAMRYDLELKEAEDCVLETFHHVWQIRQELKSSAALHTLLFMATRNRSLNVAQKNKNRQKIVNEKLPLMEEEEEGRDYLMEEEISRELDEAVSKLPKQCEQVITGLLAGKSLQTIAEEMQISVNTAKTYKLRAIQALRNLLSNTPFILLLILIGSDEDEEF